VDIDEWNNGREKWAPLMGRLILAFGEIEYCFMVCLAPLNSHEGWEKLKHADFKTKASKSIAVLSSKYKRYPECKQAIYLINESIKRVKVRNLVAHNPLNIAPFNDVDGNIEFQLVIGSLRNHEIHINEKELTNTMKEIEEIATELHNIVNRIWTERE